MKILLIDPPFYRFIKYYNRFFPLGLTCLAGLLRQAGHEVVIYDADANVDRATEMDFSALESRYPEYIRQVNDLSHPLWDELRDVLSDTKPDLAGISVFTTKIAAALRTTAIIKSIDKSIPVVMGGPHPSVKADELLRINPHVDFAVRGEGEIPFLELIQAIENNSPHHDIKGLSFRYDNQVRHNNPADFVTDLDTLPYPARDLLLNKSSYTPEDMGLIMAGRGCPFSCTFCSSSGVWKKNVRYRSIENVLGEIQQVQHKYGTVQFCFKDDTFIIDRQRVLDFCRQIKSRGGINWECNARVNLIDETLLAKMKSAGCNSIKVGIESGSERILDSVMQKGITVAQIRKAARAMRKAGIHWTGYFMMGLPTETKEEMQQTLCLMRQIKPDFASLSVYEPFPGTQLYASGLEMGYVADDRSLEDYYNIPPKYYYIKNIKHRTDTMSNEEFSHIESITKTSFHRYNRGPGRILKRARARSFLYLKNPKTLSGDFRKFLAWVR